MKIEISENGQETVFLEDNEFTSEPEDGITYVRKINEANIDRQLYHYEDRYDIEKVKKALKRGRLTEVAEFNGNVVGIYIANGTQNEQFFSFPHKEISTEQNPQTTETIDEKVNRLQDELALAREEAFQQQLQRNIEQRNEIENRRQEEKQETLRLKQQALELKNSISSLKERLEEQTTLTEHLTNEKNRLTTQRDLFESAQLEREDLEAYLPTLEIDIQNNYQAMARYRDLTFSFESIDRDVNEEVSQRNQQRLTELEASRTQLQKDRIETQDRIKNLNRLIRRFDPKQNKTDLNRINSTLSIAEKGKSELENEIDELTQHHKDITSEIRGRSRRHVRGDISAALGFVPKPIPEEGLAQTRSLSETARSIADTISSQSKNTKAALAVTTVLAVGSAAVVHSPDNGITNRDPHIAALLADGSTKQVSYVSPIQTTSKLTLEVVQDEDIRHIAKRFGTTSREISATNDDVQENGIIKAGTTLTFDAPTSTIRLDKPTSAQELAKAFALDVNIIAGINGVSPDKQDLTGTVSLVGRIGFQLAGTPDINKIADTLGLDLDELKKLNANAPSNTVILPTYTDDYYEEHEFEDIHTLVTDNKPAEKGAALELGTPKIEPQSPNKTASTTSSTDVPTTTPPATTPPAGQVPSAPAISPEVQRVNDALGKITLGQTHDLTELTEAVKAMYAAYAPNDPNRRADLPAGYVKFMLPNEAVGIAVPFTVAERTANLERYGAPELYAGFLTQAKLHQDLVNTKYPQLKGSMARMRDANSPNHATHNHGLMLDTSSSMGPGIGQYSDGPYGDKMFSKNYSEAFTKDLLIEMSRTTTRGIPTFQRAITSLDPLIAGVNGPAGWRFTAKDKGGDHQDHIHYILNKAFALPQFNLRARDLPWGTEQDLRIGGMAQPIDQAILDQEHAPYIQWLKGELDRAAGAIAKEPAEPAAPAPSNPKGSDKNIPNIPELSKGQLPEIAQSVGASQFEKVKANGVWDVYKEIEKQTGVPAQYMFAIHYREGGNQPDVSMYAGEKLGAANPDNGHVMGDDLLENGLKAAEHFKSMAKNVYGVDVTADDLTPRQLAQAFLAYNRGEMYDGNAKKVTGKTIDVTQSPYAMNYYESDQPMKFIGEGHLSKGEGDTPSWGEPESTQGKTNKSIGALAMVEVAGGIDRGDQRPTNASDATNAPNTNRTVVNKNDLSR